MNTFKFFELSENGFTLDGMYAHSVLKVSVKLDEVREYAENFLRMNPDEIPVDPDGEPTGLVIRTREIKY